MYGSDKVPDDSERTAFRRAEKQHKLYYQFNSKKKKLPKHVDLSDVLDFRNIRESYDNNGELPLGIVPLSSGFGCPVFRLETRPGIR